LNVIAEHLNSRRVRFWVPWISALVLVAGTVTFLIVYNVGGIRNTAHQYNPPVSNKPAVKPTRLGPTVPLPTAAKLVAARWVRDAVGRLDLAEAWRLSAPELREGMSYKQWLTGNIPVVPYPLKGATGGYSAVAWSTKNDVSLLWTFVPKKGKASDFYINLRTVGAGRARHWVVYYWGPRALPPIPDASAQH
jgi:hypothetical protein